MSGREPEHLDDMSPDEVLAWAERQRERSRREFAGQPTPTVSRAKRDDHPHWQRHGWGFRLRAGAQVRVVRADGRRAEATSGGLRPVQGGGPPVLVVRMDDEAWALSRADGEVWADREDADRSPVDVLDVPVRAWRVQEDPPGGEVAAPGRGVESWTARTNDLPGQL